MDIPSGNEQQGCIRVYQEHYHKGIQDPAIVVNYHRVSLLTLEAWGTLRQKEEEEFQGKAWWSFLSHPENLVTRAAHRPVSCGSALSCTLGGPRMVSSCILSGPGTLTEHSRGQAGGDTREGGCLGPTEEHTSA